jgi:hypothetical protein
LFRQPVEIAQHYVSDPMFIQRVSKLSGTQPVGSYLGNISVFFFVTPRSLLDLMITCNGIMFFISLVSCANYNMVPRKSEGNLWYASSNTPYHLISALSPGSCHIHKIWNMD